MDTYTQPQRSVADDFNTATMGITRNEEPAAAASRSGRTPRRTNAELTRSAMNIARWRTFLPEDCVQTMIAMGWDRTT